MTRRTTWPHGGVDGPHPALLGGQGEVLVVASHGVLDVGRHHIVVSHVGGWHIKRGGTRLQAVSRAFENVQEVHVEVVTYTLNGLVRSS